MSDSVENAKRRGRNKVGDIRVGDTYTEADGRHVETVNVDGSLVEIRANYWEDKDELAVTQRVELTPTQDCPPEDVFAWFHQKSVEVIALTGLDYKPFGTADNAVFWRKPA